ncbi:MAG TPA: hypothetical protein VD838_05000, partial [Anaeromyxobacteraceae bacterium]|nr:hypothetical protein [Anaeromyxobacteraceae bacterium]
ARAQPLPALRPATPAAAPAPAEPRDEAGLDEAAREARGIAPSAPLDLPALKKRTGAADDDEELLP